MEPTDFETYLKDRYYDQMNFYDKSSIKNQKKYKQFQWVLIVLSALTPVISAIAGSKNSSTGMISIFGWCFSLHYLVIIVSSIVAILTTGLKTFGYQELWVKYRSTHEKLKPEYYYYEFGLGPYAVADGESKEAVFVNRVEAILSAEHAEWPPAKSLRTDGSGSSQASNPGNNNS